MQEVRNLEILGKSYGIYYLINNKKKSFVILSYCRWLDD